MQGGVAAGGSLASQSHLLGKPVTAGGSHGPSRGYPAPSWGLSIRPWCPTALWSSLGMSHVISLHCILVAASVAGPRKPPGGMGWGKATDSGTLRSGCILQHSDEAWLLSLHMRVHKCTSTPPSPFPARLPGRGQRRSGLGPPPGGSRWEEGLRPATATKCARQA